MQITQEGYIYIKPSNKSLTIKGMQNYHLITNSISLRGGGLK